MYLWCKNLVLITVLGLFASSATAVSGQHGNPTDALNQRFNEAMAAQDRGDYKNAESILRSLHAGHPGIFAIDESLGLVCVAQEKFKEALPFLQAAAREQPDSDAAHANLGAVLFRLQKNQEALAEFETAAHLNPNNAATQQSLGRLWMEEHQPAKAAVAFAAAIQLDATNTDLILDRAQALEQAGQLEEADGAVRMYPDLERSAQAQELLGEIAEKRGAYKDAAVAFEQAVKLDPSEANAWALGAEFLRHWTFDAAIREFEAAVVLFPQSTRMHLGLGAAYFGNGSYAKAIPVFADLLDADKNNKLYAEMLGISCTAVMREERPRCSSLFTYVDVHPKDALAATYAATTIVDGQSSDAQQATARRLLETAIRADPKLAEAHLQLAMLDQYQTQWAASVPELQTAVRLKPDLAKAHYRLSLAYWRTGRKDDAKSEMALEQKYAQQQRQDLDKKLRQITTFVMDARQ